MVQATNPDFDVVARAGGQIKLALDCNHCKLGGENYVFWGGTRRLYVVVKYRYGT